MTDIVGTVRDAWREDFPGTAIRTSPRKSTDPWKVIQTGPEQSISVSNSNLVITTGTQVGTTIIRSKKSWLGPFRAIFQSAAAMLSQRIANQEFELRLTDEDGTDYASAVFDGTTATIVKLRAYNGGATATDISLAGAQSTAGAAAYELEVTPADIFLHSYVPDATTGRAATARKTIRIPDPDVPLFIEIRVRNTATAASSTTFTLDSILVEDIEEMTAEITGGRGGVVRGNSLPLWATGGTVDGVTTVATVTRAGAVANLATTAETTANLGANAVYTGASKDLGASPNVARIRAYAMSDQAGTLAVDVSHDGTAWSQFASAAVVAGGANYLDLPAITRYWRIRYTNGAVAQASFRVYAATVAA